MPGSHIQVFGGTIKGIGVFIQAAQFPAVKPDEVPLHLMPHDAPEPRIGGKKIECRQQGIIFPVFFLDGYLEKFLMVIA